MAKISAIYKIYFINANDVIYIGSAVDFNDRKIRHKHQLKKGTHKNQRLQRMYNKYGVDCLCFDIIEIIEQPSDLIKKEQEYIDTLNPELNILKIAGSAAGYVHSAKTKAYLSALNKGKKMSIEQNLRNSAAQKGNKNAKGAIRTLEVRNNLSNKKKKKVVDLSNGEIYSSLSNAAALNGLKICTLSAKLRGRIINNTNLRYL